MKKWLHRLLVMVLAVNITACGRAAEPSEGDSDSADEVMEEEPAEPKNYKDGVIDASELFVKNGVAFWGYKQQLCSALLDDNSDLYDFVSEGNLSGDIYSIALDGNNMYLSTETGIVCLPLEESEQEQSRLSVIDEHELSSSFFQIYDGNIYFIYGTTLYLVPEKGGESKTLEKEIRTFQVTVDGIYCINREGDLICVSLDGTERKTLCELDSEGEIFILNDKAYITTGDDKDYIYVYGLEDGTMEKLHFEKDLSPYHPVWVTEECIYYESDKYEIFRYDFESETESQSGAEYDLPDYSCGYLENDVLYYVYSDNLYWMHLDHGESFKLGKGEALEKGSVSDTASDTGAASDTDAAGDSMDGGYHIAEDIGVYNSEGQARLESKYFTLYLPADGDWIYKAVDNSTVSIYYEPAYESGNGGHLVTIKAYDWGDNSYEDFPSYKIAGLSDNKKYIAVFPTDVQFDSSQEAGYRKLFQYVQRIDNSEEHSADNPFSCR